MSTKNDSYLQIAKRFKPQNIYPGISKEDSEKLNIVPLWADQENYYIGTADAGFNKVDEIERFIKKPVHPILLTYLQLELLQEQLYSDRKLELPDIGISEIQAFLQGEQNESSEIKKALKPEKSASSTLQSLTEEEALFLEALGIRHCLPHIDLNMINFQEYLSVLVPFQDANKYQIIPLWWIGSRLYLGLNAAAFPDRTEDIEEIFPFDIQLVLCEEKQWKKIFRAKYLEQKNRHEISDEDRIKILQKSYSLNDYDMARAKIYSEQYRTSYLIALEVLKIVSSDVLLKVESQLAKIPVWDMKNKPDVSLKNVIPPGIARKLQIIVFEENNRVVVLGETISKEAVNLVQAFTLKTASPFLIDNTSLTRWMDAFYPQEGSETTAYCFVPLKEVILKMGLVSEEQMNEAAGGINAGDRRLGELLLEKDYLDDVDLSISQSIQTGIPFTLMEHANLPRELFKTIPKEIAKEYHLLPLINKGNCVLIATDDPYNGKGFREFQNTGADCILPVLAPKSVLHAILERNVGSEVRKVTVKTKDEIQGLIYSDYLTQSQAYQMTRLIETEGISFDEAFIRAGYYDENQAVEIFTSVFSTPSLDVSLIEEKIDQIDGLGNKITRTIYRDPVNLGIAGMIDLEVAMQYCMLPIRKEGKKIIVAFADPMYIRKLKYFAKYFPLPIQPVLVGRTDLYDAITRNLGRKNIGTYLLEKGYITRRQLNEALDLSRRTGVRLGQALLTMQFIQEEQMYEVLAHQAKMRFMNLNMDSIKDDTVRLIDPEIEREFGILPIKATQKDLTLAVVDPFDQRGIEKAEMITGRKIHPIVTTDADLEKALEKVYHEDYTAISTSNLLTRSPRESAFHVLSRGQTNFLLILLLISAVLMIFKFAPFVIFVNEIITIFYVCFSIYKFYLVYSALNHDCEVPISQEEIDALDPKDLPIYTLLIPVYKEAEVLPELLRSLTHLDYPSTKLDIKILLEVDDKETIQKFYDLNLPPHFRATIVPDSLPRTKPKACNYGLIHARGEYVVIFDAEDRPDSDQLKKAVIAFQKSDPNVVCIQAKLNYYNRTQNLLTQWFTSEYSMWFDLFLPGLDASSAPIPLGGTSNHFKRNALVEVGAWDPHNVTEDADLGMRLYKRGFHTRTIDSTTYEEANSRLNNWLRQRSRWLKGYIQTWLVHMRDPLKLLKETGVNGFISFQFVIGGTFFSAIINPLLWTLTTVWYLTHWEFIQESFPGFIFYLSSVSLYLGNFVFTYMNVAGAMRRKHYDNVRFAILSPIYWGLMSIGAWKGFTQLITKPHYWEKTIHGFSKGFEMNMRNGNDKKEGESDEQSE